MLYRKLLNNNKLILNNKNNLFQYKPKISQKMLCMLEFIQ